MLIWRKYPGLLRLIIIIVLVMLIIFVFTRSIVYPVFFTLAEVEAIRMGNRVINEVINQRVAGVEYKDLIRYEVNNAGDIILMQANIREINQLTSRISLDIQENFIDRKEIKIPLLRVLGFDMLAGMGPDLRVRIIPVGYIEPPKLVDTFEAAGINQTRHKIYLQTDVNLKMIAPFSHQEIVLAADVPVIEVTLLGKVPEVYVDLGGDGFSGILE